MDVLGFFPLLTSVVELLHDLKTEFFALRLCQLLARDLIDALPQPGIAQ